MGRMPLRYKMTLLYSGLTALLFTVLLLTLYFTVERALMSHEEDLLHLSHAQLLALVEMEDGEYIVVEEELRLSQSAAYLITDEQGKVLIEHQMPLEMNDPPFIVGELRQIDTGDGRWLLLDDIDRQDGLTLRIRMCISLQSVQSTMQILALISLIAAPLLLLASILGGLAVSRHALKPIDHIIASTKIVAQGNLSQRIDGPQSRDEVGELARMLNNMLDQVEASFLREKRFASDASHELRTPVSIIMAYAESLEQDIFSEEEQKSVQTILSESRHMQRIIVQLLMITRGESGKITMEPQPVDLGEIACMVAEHMKPAAQEQEIELHLEIEPDALAFGDQSLLTQLTINLVENAIKYGKPHGNVHIHVAKSGKGCRVTIADDGMGISQESLPHIFERFYRADLARDRSGTGLGLSIVKWIVDMHHGEIAVQSELGKGTTFLVTI